VKKLVGIELWTVPREQKEPNARLVFLQPLLDRSRPVNRVPIENEEHLALGVPKQAAEELDHYPRRESNFEHHEGEPATVRDRRDNVAAEPFACPWDDRSLPARAVGAARLMIGAQPHLVAPVNLGIFALRTVTNRRVLLLQPAPHRFWVPLVCTTHWLLRS